MQQDSEFIAAKAGHDVGPAHICNENVGHMKKRRITRGMAVEIVDGFEIVEVNKDQANIRAVPVDIGQRALQFPVKAAPVQNRKQDILMRTVLKFDHLVPGGTQLILQPVELSHKLPYR